MENKIYHIHVRRKNFIAKDKSILFMKKIVYLQSCLTKMEPADLEQYKTSCVYDVCWVNDNICQIASQLVKDCQNNYGMNLTDWRSPKLCGERVYSLFIL